MIVTVISVPSFSTNRTVSSVTDLYALKVRNNMPRGRVATQSYFHGSQAPTWTPEGPRLERQSCSPDAKGFAALSSASLRFLQKPATLIRVFQLTLSPQVANLSSISEVSIAFRSDVPRKPSVVPRLGSFAGADLSHCIGQKILHVGPSEAFCGGATSLSSVS